MENVEAGCRQCGRPGESKGEVAWEIFSDPTFFFTNHLLQFASLNLELACCPSFSFSFSIFLTPHSIQLLQLAPHINTAFPSPDCSRAGVRSLLGREHADVIVAVGDTARV
jgi:hypothetical protein